MPVHVASFHSGLLGVTLVAFVPASGLLAVRFHPGLLAVSFHPGLLEVSFLSGLLAVGLDLCHSPECGQEEAAGHVSGKVCL